MIQDLHSHSYYSFCGKDSPETIVEAAIAGGIELYGICDHNHGVGLQKNCVRKADCDLPFDDYERTLVRYFDHINLIREKYADRIRVLRGLEICTARSARRMALPASADVSLFDYCLIEQLDAGEDTVTEGDLFSFVERCGTTCGVAHTDLFAHAKALGEDPYRYFRRMAEAGIFWEMNVSYDSIHKYREHPYMLRFFESEEEQAIVRESGVRLSVGFDGHKVEDYRPDRVRTACERITKMGIKLAFEE